MLNTILKTTAISFVLAAAFLLVVPAATAQSPEPQNSDPQSSERAVAVQSGPATPVVTVVPSSTSVFVAYSGTVQIPFTGNITNPPAGTAKWSFAVSPTLNTSVSNPSNSSNGVLQVTGNFLGARTYTLKAWVTFDNGTTWLPSVAATATITVTSINATLSPDPVIVAKGGNAHVDLNVSPGSQTDQVSVSVVGGKATLGWPPVQLPAFISKWRYTVTGVTVGEDWIVAKAGGVELAKVKVYIAEVTFANAAPLVTSRGAVLVLQGGSGVTIPATVNPSVPAVVAAVTYNEEVGDSKLTVTGSGTASVGVLGNKLGNTKIIAKINGFKAGECPVTVFKVILAKPIVPVGMRRNFVITYDPPDVAAAAGPVISFSINDTNIASVVGTNGNGASVTVQGNAPGTTQIFPWLNTSHGNSTPCAAFDLRFQPNPVTVPLGATVSVKIVYNPDIDLVKNNVDFTVLPGTNVTATVPSKVKVRVKGNAVGNLQDVVEGFVDPGTPIWKLKAAVSKMFIQSASLLAKTDSKIFVTSDLDNSAYENPCWVQDWDAGATIKPVAYSRGQDVKGSAKFWIKGKLPANTQVRGKRAGVVIFPAAKVTQAPNDEWTIFDYPSTKSTDATITSTVKYYSAFSIDWEASVEGGAWEAVGTSTNPVYVTLKTPNQTPRSVVHTVIHVGCVAGDGLVDEPTIFNNVWAKFSSKSVNRASDGYMLSYYSYQMQTVGGTVQAQSPTVVQIFDFRGLIRTGNGQCNSWMEFFTEVFKGQGMRTLSVDFMPGPETITKIWVQPTGPFAFRREMAVNNWAVNGAGPWRAVNYGLPGMPSECLALNAWQAVPIPPIVGTATDQVGIAGQGYSPNPVSIFSQHFITRIGARLYDPSYGTFGGGGGTLDANKALYDNPAFFGGFINSGGKKLDKTAAGANACQYSDAPYP